MRLWTVHPRYLDGKGLTALWREGLLARAVLRGMTKGYTNHPQLIRFRAHPDPVSAIEAYLAEVLAESRARGYHYDATKIDETITAESIAETSGQLEYEWGHLLEKLKHRDTKLWEKLKSIQYPVHHPSFIMTNGPVQKWEKGYLSENLDT